MAKLDYSGRWVCVAVCVSTAVNAVPASANEAGESPSNLLNADAKLAVPEIGFGRLAKCSQINSREVLPFTNGLGRLGGFDLNNLDAPRFGQRPCDYTQISAQRRNPGSVANKAKLADERGAAVALQFVTPAQSKNSNDVRAVVSRDAFDGNYALVGLSIGSIPTYEGSRHSKIMPVPGALGRIGGIDFRIAGPSLTLDFIKGKPDAKVGLALGPSIRYRFNRNGKTGDNAVDQLGKLKGVIEGGVNAGVTIKRVLTKYDLLSIGVSARWDISGRGSGVIASPSVSYLTPLSKAQVVGALVSADFVDKRFARYNYSVTPAGSTASGLPVYNARGGFKQASVGAFTARDLSGNILDGGFAVGVGAMYSKLYGSAAKTPITALRGKSSQWIFGGGLTYTF
jgi:MipA family protein